MNIRLILIGICIYAILSFAKGEDGGFSFKMKGVVLTEIKSHTEEEVRELLRRAEAGEAEAQEEVSVCYGRGNGVKQDYTEAFKWAMAAAKQGYAPAEHTVGTCYLQGKGVEPNIEEGCKWILMAADKGDVTACSTIALLYITGEGGVELNYEKGIKYVRRAAEKGDVQAYRALGFMYLNGYGVEQDVELGRLWLEKAIEQGDAETAWCLGCLSMSEGKIEEGIRWMKQAAGHEHVAAAISLGRMYKNGDGVPQDLEQARIWYEKGIQLVLQGVEQGEVEAEWGLARVLMSEGQIEEGIRWMKQAAEHGHEVAAQYLVKLYQQGEVVPQDLEQARIWNEKVIRLLQQEAAKGDKIAEERIKNVANKKTDNGENAQPRLYSIHLFGNPLFTDSNDVILSSINKILRSGQSYDFGCVEDDGSITSADHSNMKNNPATFIQSTPEEWASQADPQNQDNYDVELWCVVCSDNQIQCHQCENRHTSNFFK